MTDMTIDEMEVRQLAELDDRLDTLAAQAREIRDAQNRIMIKRQQRNDERNKDSGYVKRPPFEVVAAGEYDSQRDEMEWDEHADGDPSPGMCECGKVLGH